jgi:hypothetical protein
LKTSGVVGGLSDLIFVGLRALQIFEIVSVIDF